MTVQSARPLIIGMPFLHEAGQSVLEPHHRVIATTDMAEIERHLGEADGFYTYLPFSVDAAMIKRSPRLKIIAAAGSGIDHIAVEEAQAAGIVVTHAVGFGALSVAEHAIGLMLAVAKRIVENDAHVRAGGSFAERRLGELYEEISGRTLAIIGFGAIGSELARIAHRGFGMSVLAVTRDGRPAISTDVEQTLPLPEALALGDIISVHTPLTPMTRGLLGAAELALMKPGAYVIDTSRGGVINPQALHAALASGHLGGAGLDVFEPEPPGASHPLLSLKTVVVSPHNAGFTRSASRRLSLAAADDLARALRGERPVGFVGSDAIWAASQSAKIGFKR